MLRLYRFSTIKFMRHIDQRADIADGIGPPAMTPGGILHHLWHMVADDKPSKAGRFQRSHGAQRIHLALVDKTFVETIGAALYIAEVDIDDLAPFAKELDGLEHILLAAHFGPAAHAEIEPMHGAVKGRHR